jgi:hypothetical protein
MQRRVVVPHQLFGTTYWSPLPRSSSPRITAQPSKMGLTGCPKTSIQNYHSMLRKIPKEHSCPVKTNFIIPVRHKLCYHSCLTIQLHVNHMAPNDHTKIGRNLTTVLIHGTYKNWWKANYLKLITASFKHITIFTSLQDSTNVYCAHSARKVLKYNYWVQELLKGVFTQICNSKTKKGGSHRKKCFRGWARKKEMSLFFHPCNLYLKNLYRVYKCKFWRVLNLLSFKNPIRKNRSVKHNKHIIEVYTWYHLYRIYRSVSSITLCTV